MLYVPSSMDYNIKLAKKLISDGFTVSAVAVRLALNTTFVERVAEEELTRMREEGTYGKQLLAKQTVVEV